MNYSFPKIKFIDEISIDEQVCKIAEEYHEFIHAESVEQEIKEAMDIYQALESYFRMHEKNGVDIKKFRDETQDKNQARDYYNDPG